MKFVKKNLICLVATVLAIVSICLFFAECVKADKLGLAFTGFEVMFGQTLEKSFVSVEVIGFSFGAFAALLLLIIGIAILWLDVIPFYNYISAGLLLVSAVLVFLFPQLLNSHDVLDYAGTAILFVNGALIIINALICAGKPLIAKKIKF